MFKSLFFYKFTFLGSIVLNTLTVLFIILLGGILPLYERKFLSLTQRRVGPKFVGFKGRLQFLADALKVIWKEFIVLFNVNSFYFFLLPILYLNINLIFFINVYWFANTSVANIEYNLVFFIILDIVLHLILVVVGFFLKNKYTLIASSRLVNISFSLEFFILLIDMFYIFLLKSFSFSRFFLLNNYMSLLFLSVILLPVFIIFFLIETAKTPFDIVEAETEIVMGYHVEYSGFLFGLFVLSEYFHVIVGVYLIHFFFI